MYRTVQLRNGGNQLTDYKARYISTHPGRPNAHVGWDDEEIDNAFETAASVGAFAWMGEYNSGYLSLKEMNESTIAEVHFLGYKTTESVFVEGEGWVDVPID